MDNDIKLLRLNSIKTGCKLFDLHQPKRTCHIKFLLKLIVKSIHLNTPNNISKKKKKPLFHVSPSPSLSFTSITFPLTSSFTLIDRRTILVCCLSPTRWNWLTEEWFWLLLFSFRLCCFLKWILFLFGYKSKKRIKIKKVWLTAVRLQVDLMSLDISLWH